MSEAGIQSVQTSLTGTTETGRDVTGIANAATMTNPEKRAVEDLGTWESPDTEYGLETRWLTTQTRSQTANTSVEPHHVRWVTGGNLVRYISQYSDGVHDVPGTYGDFENWDTYVGKVDTAGDRFGYGISKTTLERVLRVLSGGGRYNESRYFVITCGDRPFVLTGPEGTLLCALTAIKSQPSQFSRRFEIEVQEQTIEICEENDAVLSGIKRLFEIAELDVDEWCRLVNSFGNRTHKFAVQSGDEEEKKKFRSTDLASIGQSYRDEESIRNDALLEYDEVSQADPLQFRIGETYEPGVALGYRLSRKSYSDAPESTVGIQTLFLDVEEAEPTLNYRTQRLTTTSK
jgi:hypothetical protein